MKETQKLITKIEKWIMNNGACSIDLSKESILLYNGGLFEDMDEQKATLWIGDLDDTIRYMKRLQRVLKTLGFNTGRNVNDYFLKKKYFNRK